MKTKARDFRSLGEEAQAEVRRLALRDVSKRLIAHRKKKIFLIVDNLRVHHAKKIKSWTEDHKTELEIFSLPSYASQHNPDEFLNNALKQNIHRDLIPNCLDTLKRSVLSSMRSVQKRPALVRSFFDHKNVQYAG